MVTASTYRKQPLLNTIERRDYFLATFFACAEEFGWTLHAWALLPNHYHFIAASPEDPASLRRFLAKLHMTSSKHLNELDGQAGRKVWFQFWDSRITFQRSYLARLNYVLNNPVHHKITQKAEDYAWCSAAWFAQHAPAGFVATVKNFKTDLLKIPDDF